MWMRMLVNQVVRQAAEDKVKGFLMDTVQGQGNAADGGEVTPEDLKCDVLLVFGSRSEAGGWVDQVEQVQSWPMDEAILYRGQSGGHRCLAVEAKGEATNCAFLSQLLPLAQPRLVVVAGFAVALSPDLGRRAILLATTMKAQGVSEPVQSEVRFGEMEDDSKAGVFGGVGLSRSDFPKPGAARVSLCHETEARFCDPDGFEVARVCAEAKLPWVVVRVLTERSDDNLSLPLKSLLSQESVSAKVGAAVSARWNEPKSATELWKVHEDAVKASDRLAKFLSVFLAGLEQDSA